jgi:hypothetical protein
MRTTAYGGVMSARVMKEQERKDEPQVITNTVAQRANPVLADIVDWR